MSSSQSEKAVVIGNGPSLRGFDFFSLSGVDSVGMNAAYRHWERIEWYPTYYTCLDDQLIETHANAIYNLIVSCRVKSCLLIAKILDYHPDLIDNPNIFYLESFHKARFNRESHRGITFVSSRYFRESDSSKVTTGAYAVRFAAHLGYKEISILGIDLKYVERLPEATSGEGIKLVISQTPKSNPNYFFDDYQRAGDKYNVPNPSSHGSSLHVSSFEVLANDYIQYKWYVRIVNSNKESVLYSRAILPFQELQDFLPGRKLSSLVIPATIAEIDLIEENFKLWDLPYLLPSIYPELTTKPDLILIFSSYNNDYITQRVLDAFKNTSFVKDCFACISIQYLCLAEELDYYERDYSKTVNGLGFKSGPNEMFFRIINSFTSSSGFILYMESDCIPLRQGWLDAIRELAENDYESWVIGSYYQGISTLSYHFKYHLNGNALYKVGSIDFLHFVNSVWKERLDQVLQSNDPTLAYDCLPSLLFSEARPDVSDNYEWKLFQKYASRFRATALIRNISAVADNNIAAEVCLQSILVDSSSTVIVHGKIFRDVASRMLELAELTSPPLFYWAGLSSIQPMPDKTTTPAIAIKQTHPKIIVIDKYPVNHLSATGQVKRVLLGDWDKSSYLQIWEGDDYNLHIVSPGESLENSLQASFSSQDIVNHCLEFNAQAIYFRPTDSPSLFELVRLLVDRSSIPLIIHMMDDWPERLRLLNNALFSILDPLLRSLIMRASRCLSISSQMSNEFALRYGREWTILSNGVDISKYSSIADHQAKYYCRESPFTIRYMGALADDMNYRSICDVARAVAQVHSEFPILFEIYTMDWCRSKAESDIGVLCGISIKSLVDKDQYAKLLSDSDALVIAYNFDPISVAYTRLSFANKLPECLASGSPILAYGPIECATIKYLYEIGCAKMVTEQSHAALVAVIRDLIRDPSIRRDLAGRSREHVARNMANTLVEQKFKSLVVESIDSGISNPSIVVGPYTRECYASVDETELISKHFKAINTGTHMIDVGAHHGHSLSPFLDQGWQVYAFEPDDTNRAKLIEIIKSHPYKTNLRIDSRCVSDKNMQAVPFFTSNESTGISGLSAFHQTHEESQNVCVTTLSNLFNETSFTNVDFLKIDTEGHDLFVLQGYPWEICYPSVIECEFEDAKTVPLGYDYHSLADYLRNKGYIVYVSEWHPIIKYGIKHDWFALKRYPCELDSPNAWGNLLAFKDTIDEDSLRELLSRSLKVENSKLINVAQAQAGLQIYPVVPDFLSFNFQHSNNFNEVDHGSWQCIARQDADSFWIAHVLCPGSSSDRSFSGSLRILSEHDLYLDFSLGRHGQSPYEGVSRDWSVIAETPTRLSLTTDFLQPHRSIKLQIKVISDLPSGTSIKFRCDNFGLCETPSSVQLRIGSDNFNIRTANNLFARSDFFSALAIYYGLYQRRGLLMYGDNAVRAAKILGMDWVEHPSDLSWIDH